MVTCIRPTRDEGSQNPNMHGGDSQGPRVAEDLLAIGRRESFFSGEWLLLQMTPPTMHVQAGTYWIQ